MSAPLAIVGMNLSNVSCVFPAQGVGRRYAHVVLRKADIDLSKRAGELTDDEVRNAWGCCVHTVSLNMKAVCIFFYLAFR